MRDELVTVCRATRPSIKRCGCWVFSGTWRLSSLAQVRLPARCERNYLMKLFGNEMKPKVKTQVTLALCTVVALSLASLRAQEKDQDQGAPGAGKEAQTAKVTDEQFIRAAAKSGFLEVRLAKMGVQKAQNASVKALAQRMVDDHTKINDDLKKLATSKGITVRDAEGITRSTPPTDAERTQVR